MDDKEFKILQDKIQYLMLELNDLQAIHERETGRTFVISGPRDKPPDKMQNLIKHCKDEIEWAQANIDEMGLPGNPHGYQDDDRIYLPCWKDAHSDMLDIIT